MYDWGMSDVKKRDADNKNFFLHAVQELLMTKSGKQEVLMSSQDI